MISKLLLNLVMLQSILAIIDLEDIKTVSETLVGEKQDVVINPRGPLNLLRGYIGNRCGYMYNKRFYSSEIDTYYALTKKGLSSRNEQEYDFTRTPVNDRVYKDLDTKTPEGKYLSTYHAQLIKMFPSIDGDLSIEAGRSNAFTNFLRADHVKKDTKYILAALLLLSEGVDVKIAVDYKGEKNNLVIKSKTCKEKVFVDVEMHMEGIDPFTRKYKEDIYQSETAGIVKFYMQCRDNPLLKRGGKFVMPSTREEFESGRFLNNAAFLIQTYIYEFINTAEDYKDFVNAAHELLVDQVTEKENSEHTKKKCKKGRIFDELFVAKEELSENKKYIESFYTLIKAKNENANFPFCNDSQLPRYTRVPQCKLDKPGFEKSQYLYYSDCVESTLLGLFCCLAYNLETGEYETDHMGEGISKELRDFFGDYPKPTETTDFEMHKKWSSVVVCLKNDRIDYKQDKNELLSGVGNIFLAIAEITGQKAKILELVEYIESADKAGKLNYKQEVYIADKIESIIKSLSLNKNVEVKCNQMTLGKRSNGKADILAQIVITYNFDGEKNGISLDIGQGHAAITLFRSFGNSSAKVKEKCEEVKTTYSDVDCYVGYIADHYVSTELDALFFNKADFSKKLKKVLYPVIQEGSEGIYKIFLLEKLVSNEIKGLIINSFIDSTIDKEVASANPLTRFTANILGSVPLNDPSTRYTMLKHFPLHASWQRFYPKLGFKPSENIPKEDAIWANIAKVYTYTTLANLPAAAALKAICNYIRATANNTRMEYSGVYCITRTRLFEHIVSKERVDRLVEIQSILKETTKGYNLNYVYLLWFIHVSSGVGGFSLESIKIVYDFILFDNYPKPLVFEEGISGPAEYFEKSLSVLKENKTLFCSKDDRKSIKKYNGLVSYLRKFTKTKKTGCFSMF
ncbi:hypothetical protein NERG_02231 [Nematocida ausubeli]|uniref:Uncharacterized protein n=1 Tax=Nematocida ausubeli (strain ATCC PRA-371 / ERTm2) TaxID=1913371 RepID=H8ZF62_NEMA1|nr:hypothetical protein NERG_02231 [Nematocida ausubeli]